MSYVNTHVLFVIDLTTENYIVSEVILVNYSAPHNIYLLFMILRQRRVIFYSAVRYTQALSCSFYHVCTVISTFLCTCMLLCAVTNMNYQPTGDPQCVQF